MGGHLKSNFNHLVKVQNPIGGDTTKKLICNFEKDLEFSPIWVKTPQDGHPSDIPYPFKVKQIRKLKK